MSLRDSDLVLILIKNSIRNTLPEIQKKGTYCLCFVGPRRVWFFSLIRILLFPRIVIISHSSLMFLIISTYVSSSLNHVNIIFHISVFSISSFVICPIIFVCIIITNENEVCISWLWLLDFLKHFFLVIFIEVYLILIFSILYICIFQSGYDVFHSFLPLSPCVCSWY